MHLLRLARPERGNLTSALQKEPRRLDPEHAYSKIPPGVVLRQVVGTFDRGRLLHRYY